MKQKRRKVPAIDKRQLIMWDWSDENQSWIDLAYTRAENVPTSSICGACISEHVTDVTQKDQSTEVA